MIIRMSNLFLRTLRDDPAEAEVASHKLLIRAGYIRRVAPGVYSWLPLGLRVLNNIVAIVREEMVAVGAQEVHFPALLPKEPYETSGRWQEYGNDLFRLEDRKGASYLLAPTHEEMFTLLVKEFYSSYKDFPTVLYQIQTKYRDELRPRAGLLRAREFVMKDAYSFDIDLSSLEESYQKQRAAYLRIFARLELEVVVVSAVSGAMGGSKSEEFLHPTEIGEDTFVRSAGGYCANSEAAKTAVLEPVSYQGLPSAEIVETVGVTSVEGLVAKLNADFSCENKVWVAADVLKIVVLVLVSPVGERELVAVGVGGDRNIDFKRLEVALDLSDMVLEAAGFADFAKYPQLVRGYIGPNFNDNSVDKIRFLVDSHIVSGSVWVSGANVENKHVVGLVAGRDFVWDGVVEAAEIVAGDLAVDGSGPLEVVRAMEMGHIFQLGTKYSQNLGLQVLDSNGKLSTVFMGSYGIGITRALAAIAQKNCDDKGLVWPAKVSPADLHFVVAAKQEEVYVLADSLVEQLSGEGLVVIYDDRKKVSPGVKFGDAELLGVPVIVVLGRGFVDGLVEVKYRVSGVVEQVAVAGLGDYLLSYFGKQK